MMPLFFDMMFPHVSSRLTSLLSAGRWLIGSDTTTQQHPAVPRFPAEMEGPNGLEPSTTFLSTEQGRVILTAVLRPYVRLALAIARGDGCRSPYIGRPACTPRPC